jgi:hypothetical protein
MSNGSFPISILLVLLLLTASLAQDEEPASPEAQFVEATGELYLTAQWLAAYDAAAWWSGDVVLALPRERLQSIESWFAHEAEDGWHVVYGRLTEARKSFQRTIHHRVLSRKEIEEVEDLTPGEFDVPFAHALQDAGRRMVASKARRGARFNPYVRNAGEGVEVWGLPALTGDGKIVYGVTFCWRYSADGREFKGEDVWDYGLWTSKPNPEKKIMIGCTDFDHPSPGDLFTAVRFGDLFGGIAVRSKEYVTRIEEVGLVNVHKPATERFPPRPKPEEEAGDEERKEGEKDR